MAGGVGGVSTGLGKFLAVYFPGQLAEMGGDRGRNLSSGGYDRILSTQPRLTWPRRGGRD